MPQNANPLDSQRVLKNDGRTVVKVSVGQTFTMPSNMQVPATLNPLSSASQRKAVGGQIYCVFNDVPNDAIDYGCALHPMDVVTVSAVVAGKVTISVNGLPVLVINATTYAGLLLFYA